MRKLFVPFLILTAAVCAYVPIVIAGAPYEASMGLVQQQGVCFGYHGSHRDHVRTPCGTRSEECGLNPSTL